MKIKSINKKPIVMYEVAGEIIKISASSIDNYKTMMQDRDVKSHSEQFRDFISSLGFEIEDDTLGLWKDTDRVKVDGVSMAFDYGKVSLLSTNAYKREYRERADRCIEIKSTGYPENVIAKIKFNIELDRDAIIKKIAKYISEVKQANQEHSQKELYNKNQLQRIRMHYFGSEIIAALVNSIVVEEGFLYLWGEFGEIKVDSSTGVFIGFIPKKVVDFMTTFQMEYWVQSCLKISEKVLLIESELRKIGAIGGTFNEFAKEAHRQSVQKSI